VEHLAEKKKLNSFRLINLYYTNEFERSITCYSGRVPS